jgi:hypothetical protein
MRATQTTSSPRPMLSVDAFVSAPGKENGVGMSAVNLDDKAGLVLIDLHNGILGLLTAVPPTR